MIEIKFRAFSKVLNMMMPIMTMKELVESDGDTVDYEDLIIMQYTGLKDKNGVEIYEGDIIQDCESNTGEVSYIQDHCQFLINMGEGIDLQEIGDWCEVIGNIYENSDILKC